ncbi:MAG: hypothetical protein AAF750_14530 [Planctomycetota bacterium]
MLPVLSRLALLLPVLLLAPACSTPTPTTTHPAAPYPPDFAAALLIRHPNPTPDTPEHLRPSLSLIQPDRTLRAATGPGTHLNLFPRPSATLPPDALAHLYQQLADAQLFDPTPTHASIPPNTPTLTARITAHRHVHRRTIPLTDDHPHALAVAHTLTDLRTTHHTPTSRQNR